MKLVRTITMFRKVKSELAVIQSKSEEVKLQPTTQRTYGQRRSVHWRETKEVNEANEHVLNAGIYVGLSIVSFFRLLRGPKSTCDSVEYHHRIRLFMSRVPRSKLATYEGRKKYAQPCLA